MELFSLSLKRLIDWKKNKEDTIRIKNINLVKEIKEKETVFYPDIIGTKITKRRKG